MVSKALFVRLEAKQGKEPELEGLLRAAVESVKAETGTVDWFAAKLGPSTFAIFDTFENDAGRSAHMRGQVAAALAAQGGTLLASAPTIEQAEILAFKPRP